MTDPRASLHNGANTKAGRSLPSWISARESETKSHGKKAADEENDGTKTSKQAKESSPSKKPESSKKSSPSSSGPTNFSKLLEGVVFVLSGFVNPERSTLRSQALEMGAEYQQDWNSNCTLLVCAFANTPKFRQVEADCGTIVSKEWISECYNQRKLVDIEIYLMHAGKPWRKQNISNKSSQDLESSLSRKSLTQIDRRSHAASPKVKQSGSSNPAKECFCPSKVKKWAIDDLNKTVSWLESQEEKPEASEIKSIAAEGILTCLQDAIDSLKEKQDVQQMTEQWNFIPLVVEELAKFESTTNGSAVLSKEELCREAMNCKKIYEVEFRKLDDDSLADKKRPRTDETKKGYKGRTRAFTGDEAAYDSDETIEMTEEDVELAYNAVASKLKR
ncbi:DNA-repair protein XRCC1 isoform X2 [Rhododendron vialii]|uniref:DNA-repair protein XRCC1 isoform X2 n=1 Tax=Rhododendron vialii TaxID=182163 RepID=UPI00265FC7A8|nr:DNA-repair protein XRCC1 isoform X2 [Rhododendron vialii]